MSLLCPGLMSSRRKSITATRTQNLHSWGPFYLPLSSCEWQTSVAERYIAPKVKGTNDFSGKQTNKEMTRSLVCLPSATAHCTSRVTFSPRRLKTFSTCVSTECVYKYPNLMVWMKWYYQWWANTWNLQEYMSTYSWLTLLYSKNNATL